MIPEPQGGGKSKRHFCSAVGCYVAFSPPALKEKELLCYSLWNNCENPILSDSGSTEKKKTGFFILRGRTISSHLKLFEA